jgi:flagellin
MAIRNVMDGISLTQTADGALGEIGDILQRMRELSVRASTDTLSDLDRAAYDLEVNELKLEINRISEQTQYNGIKLLDGNVTALPIQSGVNQGETLSIGIRSAHADVLGTALNRRELNRVVLTFSGGTASEGEKIFVGGVPVFLPVVDISVTDEASYWNEKIAEKVQASLRESEQFKNFSIAVSGNAVVVSAEAGIAIPSITLLNTENTDIEMAVTDSSVKQFTATSYATTLGFTADPYPAGHIITVAGVNVALTTYTAGADPTVTSWGHRVAVDVRQALEAHPLFSRYVVERDGNTLLVIPPSSEKLNLVSFDDFGGQNIGMAVDAGSGFIDGVWYGNNTWDNFIGTTRNTSLTFTGGRTLAGGSVKIGDTQIALPSFDGAVSSESQYWDDLLAETIRAGLEASAEFDRYLFKRVDNTLLVFAAGNAEVEDFVLVNSSNAQVEMTVDAPTQNLATTSSSVLASEFRTNVEGLERVSTYGGKSLTSIDLNSQDAARQSLSTIDSAIDAVSASRTHLGAFLNRLEYVASTLSEFSLNTSESRSRMLDTNYAVESADLARKLIVSQSAQAMLGQANQSTQLVLSLLRERN